MAEVASHPLRFLAYATLVSCAALVFFYGAWRVLFIRNYTRNRFTRTVAVLATSGLLFGAFFVLITKSFYFHIHDGSETLATFAYNGGIGAFFSLFAAAKPREAIDGIQQNAEYAESNKNALPLVNRETTKIPTTIVFAEAEDHYVKVVFEDRVELRRGNFSEMIVGFPDQGMRIHRSFWVNHKAVVALIREGRQLYVLLGGGTKLPVSRKRECQVAEHLRRNLQLKTIN